MPRLCVCLLMVLAYAALAYGKDKAALPQAHDSWFTDARSSVEEARRITPIDRPARNVIFFIGDGMGVSTITAARIYEGQLRGLPGEGNRLSFEKFPYTALTQTYNTNQQVPDSAGTATAFHTGVKTKAGVIGLTEHVDRGMCRDIDASTARTLVELAEQSGLATGIITTARITHATPASAYAHVPERSWESDGKIPPGEQGKGCVDIARQLVEFPYGDGIEVVMGGGRTHFLPRADGDAEQPHIKGLRKDDRNLIDEWRKKFPNGHFVWNRTQFDALNAETRTPVLGLFSPSHMAYEYHREKDIAGEPSLTEMTQLAIKILSRNRKGYYLFIEAGRIDHGHHAGVAHLALTDTIELHRAVSAAVEMTDEKDTLIIVSADHSHTLTIGGYPTRGNPILGKVRVNNTHGHPIPADTLAADGKPWTTLRYADGPGAWEGTRPDLTDVDTTAPGYIQQAAAPLGSETHAGEDVPIYARGPQAHLFRGVVEQTYIFHVINDALQLSRRASK